MSVSSVIAQGRAAAEARMTDTCFVSNGAPPVWDEASGGYLIPAGDVVYAGYCRVKMPNALSLRPDAGDTSGTVIRPEVHIPAWVVGVKVGAVVSMVSSVYNPALSGVKFKVSSLFRDSQATSQRLECSEAQ